MSHGANLTEPQRLLSSAIDAAVCLDRQLNCLLDAYDFYVQRYQVQDRRDELELQDLQQSIIALGTLPRQVALSLLAWRQGLDPLLSRLGFEVHVLNEIHLHMHAVSSFFERKGIDLEPYSPLAVLQALADIRIANQVFGTSKTT